MPSFFGSRSHCSAETNPECRNTPTLNLPTTTCLLIPVERRQNHPAEDSLDTLIFRSGLLYGSQQPEQTSSLLVWVLSLLLCM